jgi:poly(A) polymerase/tRNA nucleotidyltransferase (CCA-adding enzyme)
MKLPKEVIDIMKALEKGGFEAFAVGGCVRDLLLGQKPADWDITTNAKPEKIQKLFPDSVYENKFGTVGVKTDANDETLNFIEVTTYRIDEKYTDKRHPDEVKFTKKLEDDLARRDFTVNAVAMDKKGGLHDPFEGRKDLKAKILRAVGEPEKRFNEDALRLLRAVRFAAQLSAGWRIEEKTLAAIKKLAGSLRFIAKERIRDEFIKLMESTGAETGILMLRDTSLLHHIIPELEEGIDVEQNKHHIYTVFDHNVYSLGFAVKFGYNLETRLAALFHDIGKPKTKRGQGENSTFYGHEVIGARMTAKIMDRLKFPKKLAEKVITLVRYHLFYYNVDEVGETSVRRLVRKVGKENMPDLINLRIAERKGSGVPKAKPYKLRHLEFMIEKALREPLSLKELEINGNEIMKMIKIESGPKVGYILNALMNEVLDDPKRNKKDYLQKRAGELAKIPEKDLKKLAQEGKEKLSEEEEKEIKEIKKKYYVK